MREGCDRWATQARDEDNRIVFVVYHLNEADAYAWVANWRHIYKWRTLVVVPPQILRTAEGGT